MATFSLCMIVKNEEAVLERCLESLKGLFEEIVIVDTGSTDSTKEIAAKYTDKIYDFQWINDFAAARNYAFSLCSMDYIYSADADEVLDENNRRLFLDLKQNILEEIEIVQMWYLNTKSHVTTENYDRELRPKLYKRLRKFTWIDPIHESVNLNPLVYDSDIEILHMPISNHSGRDFSVFQASLDRGEHLSAKLHKMYARELMLSGSQEDFEKAFSFFFSSIYDQAYSEDERRDSYLILARYFRYKKEDGEFFKWALKDMCTTPSSDMCYEIGMYYLERKDPDEALVWFDNAINETHPIINAKTENILSYEATADCYSLKAEFDEDMRDIFLEESNKYKKMAENYSK